MFREPYGHDPTANQELGRSAAERRRMISRRSAGLGAGVRKGRAVDSVWSGQRARGALPAHRSCCARDMGALPVQEETGPRLSSKSEGRDARMRARRPSRDAGGRREPSARAPPRSSSREASVVMFQPGRGGSTGRFMLDGGPSLNGGTAKSAALALHGVARYGGRGGESKWPGGAITGQSGRYHGRCDHGRGGKSPRTNDCLDHDSRSPAERPGAPEIRHAARCRTLRFGGDHIAKIEVRAGKHAHVSRRRRASRPSGTVFRSHSVMRVLDGVSITHKGYRGRARSEARGKADYAAIRHRQRRGNHRFASRVARRALGRGGAAPDADP